MGKSRRTSKPQLTSVPLDEWQQRFEAGRKRGTKARSRPAKRSTNPYDRHKQPVEHAGFEEGYSHDPR